MPSQTSSSKKEVPDKPEITPSQSREMKTYLKIPTEIKNLDPEWIKKAFSGQRLTTEE